MKFIIGLLLVLVLSIPISPAAAKSLCRTVGDRTICILSIKRSAKNYWEYRAAVSIDGVARPTEVYNCRDRLHMRQDGKVMRFEPNSVGEFICNLIPS